MNPLNVYQVKFLAISICVYVDEMLRRAGIAGTSKSFLGVDAKEHDRTSVVGANVGAAVGSSTGSNGSVNGSRNGSVSETEVKMISEQIDALVDVCYYIMNLLTKKQTNPYAIEEGREDDVDSSDGSGEGAEKAVAVVDKIRVWYDCVYEFTSGTGAVQPAGSHYAAIDVTFIVKMILSEVWELCDTMTTSLEETRTMMNECAAIAQIYILELFEINVTASTFLVTATDRSSGITEIVGPFATGEEAETYAEAQRAIQDTFGDGSEDMSYGVTNSLLPDFHKDYVEINQARYNRHQYLESLNSLFNPEGDWKQALKSFTRAGIDGSAPKPRDGRESAFVTADGMSPGSGSATRTGVAPVVVLDFSADFTDRKVVSSLCDIVTFCFIGAEFIGIDIDAVFKVVHEANMNKRDPTTKKFTKRADGKILKPSGWMPPDIEKEVRRQIPLSPSSIL